MKTVVYAGCMILLSHVLLVHASETDHEIEILEETGFYNGHHTSKHTTVNKSNADQLWEVLLIPESTNDRVCAFDPSDGTYLFDFIIDDTSSTPQYDLQTPINAIQDPDPDFNIFVSDQVSDAVYVFDPTYGQYLYTYADGSDGLNNIRGIDFRDGHVFVTSGDNYVAEFDGPHSLVRYFIQDGSDPFDILFLDNGTALLSDIQGSTNNVRLYDTSGTLIQELFSVAFPEQIQEIPTYPYDTFYNTSFSDDRITTFLIDGTIIDTIPFSSGRGIYQLFNGNFLATNSNGVYEIDPITGSTIEQEYDGSARFIEWCFLDFGIDELNNDAVNTHVLVTPNPFSSRVELSFHVTRQGKVEITVYNVLGNKVKTIMNEYAQPGEYNRTWDATDKYKQQISNGVYFLTVVTPEQSITRKITLMR